MMVGTERDDITGMVLWDPIVNGRAYIQELTTLHREMLAILPRAAEERYIR